jgi:hypothetical protein
MRDSAFGLEIRALLRNRLLVVLRLGAAVGLPAASRRTDRAREPESDAHSELGRRYSGSEVAAHGHPTSPTEIIAQDGTALRGVLVHRMRPTEQQDPCRTPAACVSRDQTGETSRAVRGSGPTRAVVDIGPTYFDPGPRKPATRKERYVRIKSRTGYCPGTLGTRARSPSQGSSGSP